MLWYEDDSFFSGGVPYHWGPETLQHSRMYR